MCGMKAMARSYKLLSSIDSDNKWKSHRKVKTFQYMGCTRGTGEVRHQIYLSGITWVSSLLSVINSNRLAQWAVQVLKKTLKKQSKQIWQNNSDPFHLWKLLIITYHIQSPRNLPLDALLFKRLYRTKLTLLNSKNSSMKHHNRERKSIDSKRRTFKALRMRYLTGQHHVT